MCKKRRRKWLKEAHLVNPRCFYCSEEPRLLAHININLARMTHLFPKKLQATVDHYIPLAAGGPDKPGNYRLACKRCNSLKGCELPF